MCGLSGIYSKNYENIKKKSLKKILHHRGPDSFKIYEYHNQIYNFMAFNRLSILDLNKRSDQPYKYKNLILCFNGEIYNYKDLRVKLKRLKVKFHTNSDTEVLIKYLYYYGIKKTLNDIEGMWSFSLFNKKSFKLILCRDYYGEKPLLLFKKEKKFFYGSEVPVLRFYNKAKLKIDLNYVKKYLFFEYRALNANNNLLYKEIDEVKPGTYLEIDKISILKN